MMRLMACSIMGLLAASAVAGELKIEKVFGRELPCLYKHPACIAELENGDLYIAYYGGSGEYELDTAVYGSRKAKGAANWERPVTISDTPFHSDGNPVVWQAPPLKPGERGLVWLFQVVRYGDTWSDSRIHAKVSKDYGRTWSDSFVLGEERGMMVRSQPIVLANGDYLLPIYHETGRDREVVGEDTTSLFLRCDVKTMTWTETNRIHARLGALQPAVAKITEDHLVAFMRRGSGYDPRTDGYVTRAESTDGGKTWSDAVDTEFPNPNAAVDFIRLQSGHHLLVYNDSMNERTPLVVAISTDGAKTFPYRMALGQGPYDYAYPYAIQTRDGKIHIIFTSHERSQVNHAVFDESVILEGK